MMQILSEDTKFAHLGKPGTAFSKGFARRLEIMSKLVDFKSKLILDLGCGEGVWLPQFAKFTQPENVFGCDIDQESVDLAKKLLAPIPAKNLVVSPTEHLPYADGFFDIVFANEVMEHVTDDLETAREVYRIIKSGGQFVIFSPNRGWPFETHGMFIGKKYYWGNIFLLPWLPKFISKKFAPHVRNYSNSDIEKILLSAGFSLTYHRHVFPGFDGLVRKYGKFGKFVRSLILSLESTPLEYFGISHLIIAQKPITQK